MDDSILVSVYVSIAVALISLIGTIVLAIASIRSARIKAKSAELSASDEIATGSSTLLSEYRKERAIDRAKIAELGTKVEALEDWRREVIDFIVPFIEGSKRNERALIDAGIDPPYKLPELPGWLTNDKT